MKELEEIYNLSDDPNYSQHDDFYINHKTSIGDYWRSRRTIHATTNYDKPLPTGIHLGAGIANLTVSTPCQRQYSIQGPSVSYIVVDGNETLLFSTQIDPGVALSCGLFIPLTKTEIPVDVRLFLDHLEPQDSYYLSDQVDIFTIEKLCKPIDAFYQGDAKAMLYEAHAFELLAIIMSAFKQPLPLESHHSKHAKRTRDIIEAHIMKPLTLAYLAREVGINVRSLTAQFKQTFDMTINEYITHTRLEKAQQLLREGKSVNETAYHVGYSVPHFSEKFKQRFGFSASKIGKR